MMRRSATVAVWAATAHLDVAMFWVLAAGGFVDRLTAEQPAITGVKAGGAAGPVPSAVWPRIVPDRRQAPVS